MSTNTNPQNSTQHKQWSFVSESLSSLEAIKIYIDSLASLQ